MSSVVWHGDHLIQKVGVNVEELGYIRYDKESNGFVLWLRDTRGVFGGKHLVIRGDTFPTMADAKRKAASTVSARLFHHMWMVGLREGGRGGLENVEQAIADVESGNPLTESTFKKEIDKMVKRLDEAESRADMVEEKSRIRSWIHLVVGLLAGLLFALL